MIHCVCSKGHEGEMRKNRGACGNRIRRIAADVKTETHGSPQKGQEHHWPQVSQPAGKKCTNPLVSDYTASVNGNYALMKAQSAAYLTG